MPDTTINGYKHHWEEVGEGTPMLYVAGTRFDSAKKWVPYMRENAHGYKVIIPDIRGMAESEHTRDVKGEDWVKDVAGLLDHLGLDKVHFAAETLGTRIAVRFAVEYPDRVKSLILNGTIAYSYPEGDAERRAQPQDRIESMKQYHGEDAAEINEFYLDLHADPAFHEYYDLRTFAKQVTAPTLILRGDVDDDRHPISHSTEVHALIEDSWLQIFANTGFNALVNRPKESWALVDQLTRSVDD